MSSPRVLAFYYAWYDAATWNPNLVSDLPAQPYSSADAGAIARQIRQAQDAGIDAFVVAWLGPNNPTDSNFKLMLGQAQAAGFAATIDVEIEQYASRDQVINALAYVRDNLMPQASFLRAEGGRPVLFFWRQQNFSVEDWSAIRAAVDPNHQQIWIAEGTDISYQQVFDGHHLYSVAWSTNVSATLADWGARVRQAGPNKLWVATVMPGYDDTRTARPDRFLRPRGNGDFYRVSWQAAIDSQPDWVIITSYNEWVEGSQIEPSASYGNLYLDITREFARQLKTGAPPAHQLLGNPIAAPTALPTLKPDQRVTTDILRVRAGPGADYPILARLRAGAIVQVLARSEDGAWLQISYPSSDNTAWVAASFVEPQTGLGEFLIAIVAPGSSPTPQADAAPFPTITPGQDGGLPIWY